jgi:membrane-associated phospholipid phosphatase
MTCRRVSWRWIVLLGLVLPSSVASPLGAQPLDLRVRQVVRSDAWQANTTLGALSDVGNTWGAPGVILLGTGLWLGGRLADDPRMATIGFRAFEAIGVSGVITGTIKGIVGRARPRISPTDAGDLQLMRGAREGNDYQSFPSGHTTAAFAFAAAVTAETRRLAPDRARTLALTTYGLATATAFARMYSDAHWLTDVMAGAAVGIATGHAASRWHAKRPGHAIDRIFLGGDVAPLLRSTPAGHTILGATITWP